MESLESSNQKHRSRREPKHLLISKALLQDVITGRLAPGSRLPSENELAEQFNVSHFTLRQAKMELVQRGVFYSVSRQGTFVSEEATRPCVSVLWRGNFLTGSAGLGLPFMVSQLEHLCKNEYSFMHFDGTAVSYTDKKRYVFEREIGHSLRRVMVVPNVLPHIVQYCKVHSIPAIGLKFNQDLPYIRADLDNLVSDGLKYLFFERKIKDIAVFGLKGMTRDWREFRDANGLDWPDDWAHELDEITISSLYDSDGEAYRSFNHLWDQPRRPKGLIICDDVYFRGVALAICHRGVRVGQDLEIVSHFNKPSPMFIPLPFTRFEIDCDFWASRVKLTIDKLLVNPQAKIENESVKGRLVYGPRS